MTMRVVGAGMALVFVAQGCARAGHGADDTEQTPEPCAEASLRCAGDDLQQCLSGTWKARERCGESGKVCAKSLQQCTSCQPSQSRCDGQQVLTCKSDGTAETPGDLCDVASGFACQGGTCANLCQEAATEKSNVGCEYWAVDLDNAMIDDADNAAGQTFAVVVSNPHSNAPVTVRIARDDSDPGGPASPMEIGQATLAPLTLRVFRLDAREVDGSIPGTFNTGTHTALSRAAYRIESTLPVVAYQFNPLENVSVFSNDASLLKPTEALGEEGPLALSYVVAGWPQTIASTDDPNTNFNPLSPINLRAFLTIVGTREDTHVRVTTTADVVAGGPIAATPAGKIIEANLHPFDVLNLETGSFNADFTGTLIETTGPIAVFSGSEASDAPWFETLSERSCCADHLEDQLDPIRTTGKSFAIAHTPSRTEAVVAAGANITSIDEPDFVRVIAASHESTTVRTSLPAPDDEFVLQGIGTFVELRVLRDFTMTASSRVVVSQVMASQEAAGIPRGLPGGDPSLLIVPPVEQFRKNYVFLTPDKYAFDFLTIVAPKDAQISLDGAELTGCTSSNGISFPETDDEPPATYIVYTCQLSFATIDPSKEAPANLTPGYQNDGVHRVLANAPIGVFVSGFDSFVSYAYAGGTELRDLGPVK